MALLLNDDGTVQTWQADDGLQYQVASQYAPAGLGGMAAPPPQAPATAAPPPESATLPALPPPVAIQPEPPAAAPPAEVPLPAQDALPPAPAPATDLPQAPAEAPPPPSILPTGPLNTPTQVAGAINETTQAQADSVHRIAQEQGAAAQQIVDSGQQVDAALEREQAARAEERAVRQADEAALGARHQKLVDRYANFKVDPNRGMSGDRQTMAWIGAALAGLGQVISGKDPSQNPAIPIIFQQMDRRVQLQMAERDGLGQAIGQSKEGIADFRTATKTRLGEYDLRMAGELERHARLVDRVKAKLGSVEQQEAATQLAQTLRAEAVTRSGNATKAEADQRAAARRAAASAMAAAAERQRKEEVDLAKQGLRRDPQTGAIVLDPNLQDPTKALDAQGKALANEKARRDLANPATTEGSVAKIKDNAARSVNGFDGKPLMRSVVQKDAQGNDVKVAVPVMAKTEAEGTELRDMGAKYDTIQRATDLLITAIRNNGGSSGTLGGPEYQKATSLLSTVKLEAKDLFKLGVIAGPDEKLIEGSYGGIDPRSFIKNGTAGLEAMQSRMHEKYNAALRQKSDYADTSEGGGQLGPLKSAAAKVSEQRPDERVLTFTKGDPSVKGDAAAIAADADLRLAAVETFLSRDKPSPEAIDLARRQVVADNLMPAATKAKILATLQGALDKVNDPGVKKLRELDQSLHPTESVPILENLRFGLPSGAK